MKLKKLRVSHCHRRLRADAGCMRQTGRHLDLQLPAAQNDFRGQ